MENQDIVPPEIAAMMENNDVVPPEMAALYMQVAKERLRKLEAYNEIRPGEKACRKGSPFTVQFLGSDGNIATIREKDQAAGDIATTTCPLEELTSIEDLTVLSADIRNRVFLSGGFNRENITHLN